MAEHFPFAFVEEPTFVYDCRDPGAMSHDPLLTARGYDRVIFKHREAILREAGPEAWREHVRIVGELYVCADRKDEYLKRMWWLASEEEMTRAK